MIKLTREELIQELDRLHNKLDYQKGIPQDKLEDMEILRLEWKYTQADTIVEFLNARGNK